MTQPRTKSVRPDARVHEMVVTRTHALSPSFVRLTFAGVLPAFDEEFVARGDDQWFRLFLPGASGMLTLPDGGGDGWYRRWLAIPEPQRPVVRNYTVRQARRGDGGWEVDADFVLHADDHGRPDGVAARWAVAARPGDRVGLLDQGVLFTASDAAAAIADGGRIWLVADETGLPGVESILRSLPDGAPVTCLLEVPTDADRRPLPSPADVQVRWLVRDQSGPRLLSEVETAGLRPADYLYAVGEAGTATGARAIARRAGLPPQQIDFCAYWRPARRAA